MDNGSLISKHDSPQRIFDFSARIEEQGKSIEWSQGLVKNSRFFNIKEPNFQQRQQSFLLHFQAAFGL